MKRIAYLVIMMIMPVCIAGCSKSDEVPVQKSTPLEQTEEQTADVVITKEIEVDVPAAKPDENTSSAAEKESADADTPPVTEEEAAEKKEPASAKTEDPVKKDTKDTGDTINTKDDSKDAPEDISEDMDLAEYMKMIRQQAEEGEKKYQVTLEKKNTSKNVNPVEGGLFMTADKVECRSLEITCFDDIFSFGVELCNDTGSDRTFDQTGFVLEKEKGVYLNPFVFEQFREPETVSGDEKRLWTAYTIYDPGDLKEGDEVSVYYDGVFITRLTVGE